MTFEEVNLSVGLVAGSDYGSTFVDPAGAAVQLATTVPDPSAFYGNFLSIVVGSDVEPRPVQIWTEDAPPPPVKAGSSPAAVLGTWLLAGLLGDQAASAPLVAPGAPWVGLGSSPDVFVAGSAPYAAFETALTCSTAGQTALCNATWNDLWIDANPDLERGSMWVRAVVEGARIVEFEEFTFSPAVAAAFDSHVEWLRSAQPDRLMVACGSDGASVECSELLVATVDEWIADR